MDAADNQVNLVQALIQPSGFLPVGYGFRPTDAELIRYVIRKNSNSLSPIDEFMMPEVKVYRIDPWELPNQSPFPPGSDTWHFFSKKDRTNPGGQRQNRANDQGNWSVTGPEHQITESPGSTVVIGKRRTLVFYKRTTQRGRGNRTVWTIYEYTSINEEYEDYVVCCLVKKHEDTLAATRRRARNGGGETSGSFPAAISYDAAGSELPAADVPLGGAEKQLVSGHGKPVANGKLVEEENQVESFQAIIDEILNHQGTSCFSLPAQLMARDTELTYDISSAANFTGIPSQGGTSYSSCLAESIPKIGNTVPVYEVLHFQADLFETTASISTVAQLMPGGKELAYDNSLEPNFTESIPDDGNPVADYGEEEEEEIDQVSSSPATIYETLNQQANFMGMFEEEEEGTGYYILHESIPSYNTQAAEDETSFSGWPLDGPLWVFD